MGNESGLCSLGCIILIVVLIVVFWDKIQILWGLFLDLFAFLGLWFQELGGVVKK